MSVALLLLAGTALFVSDKTAHTAFESKYRLSLAASDDRFYERMPVAFDVVVENLTDEPLRIGFILKPVYYKWLQVRYRRLPGEFRTLRYTSEWDVPGHAPFEMFTLEPRGRGSFPLSLAADPARGTFIFERPGDYEIKFVRVVNRGTNGTRALLATPPLRIRVEPAPPSEADALADWDVQLAIFAQNDGGYGTSPRFRRDVTRALKFMDAHPASLYTPLLRQRTYDTLQSLRRQGTRLSDYEQEAFERLKRALREVP